VSPEDLTYFGSADGDQPARMATGPIIDVRS
jgi:hypothetical protein